MRRNHEMRSVTRPALSELTTDARARADGGAEPPVVEPANVRHDFRETMAHFPAPVTVVATSGREGPVGCTASAVLSLSLDPPSLLLSLRAVGRTAREIVRTGRFAVSALSKENAELAETFASTAAARRFDGVGYRLQDGQPVLRQAASAVVCSVTQTAHFEDHLLIAGEVLWSTYDPVQTPVIRLRRNYVPVAEPELGLLGVCGSHQKEIHHA
jgi:flavin reductase (DIM6/NTAB) family NADH-FMN oxidoreductase RutF